MNPPSLMVNNSLGIRLDRRSFVPGDTITGHVFRSTLIICPEARLELWVRGNAVSRSGASQVSFDLLYFKQHHAVLYDGPLHVTHDSGEVRWSFSITLPHRVDPRLNRGHAYRSYISLDSRPELPASYQLQGYREGGAFIEYHVERDYCSRATVQRKNWAPYTHLQLNHFVQVLIWWILQFSDGDIVGV